MDKFLVQYITISMGILWLYAEILRAVSEYNKRKPKIQLSFHDGLIHVALIQLVGENSALAFAIAIISLVATVVPIGTLGVAPTFGSGSYQHRLVCVGSGASKGIEQWRRGVAEDITWEEDDNVKSQVSSNSDLKILGMGY